MQEWKDRRVTVIGLGVTGLWLARWLLRQGARVTVTDSKPESQLDGKAVHELKEKGVRLVTGGHREDPLTRADCILLSPGVPHDAPWLDASVRRGIPVLGELELAGRLTHCPIIAVTGTNGKSTVTDFLGKILGRAGRRVFVGGNIGTPLVAHLLSEEAHELLVLEVSSFQLDTAVTFKPWISAVLNVSPDHLDRYTDYEAYVRAKLSIFKNQGDGDTMILNQEDPCLASARPPLGAQVRRYSKRMRPGVEAFIDGTRLRVRHEGGQSLVFDLTGFKLPGEHNRENLLAVVLASLTAGVPPGIIREGIETYPGLPHRLQPVAEVSGVWFYDDSKATNVAAAVRAVCSFRRPVILIAGGRHKGGDYGPLRQAAEKRVRQALLMGEARELLAEALATVVPCFRVRDMDEAVHRAHAAARPGEVVLLAPACSSFDMYRDYAERGRAFQAAVRGLGHG